jgi:hypothetical protein
MSLACENCGCINACGSSFILQAWQCCKISCHSKRRLARSSVSFRALLFCRNTGRWYFSYICWMSSIVICGKVFSCIKWVVFST